MNKQLNMLVLFLLCSTLSWSQTELPDIPDLIRVTVDHSDQGVLIQWEPSIDADIESYWVWKMRPDLSFERVMQFGGGISEFKHLTSGLKSLTYSVTAVDSAGNESLFGENVHKAVNMSAEFEPCTPATELSWTAYEGWEGQISGYRVYGAAEGESLHILDFVNPSRLNYTHVGIQVGTSYAYYIETIHTSGITSLSAIDSLATSYPEAPQFMTIDYVSVLEDQNTVEIQYTADVSGSVNNYRIVRRSNPGTPFTEVETFWDDSQSPRVIQDEFPTASISYEYQVQSIYQPPACGTAVVLSESNTGNSIQLAHGMEGQLVTLNWNPYERYSTGLSGYTIQRRSGSGEFYDIQTVGPGTTNWSESIQSVINGFQPGELQYRVLAISNPQYQGETGISTSNIVTVSVETTMQVPNAFTPGSNDMNAEFKPQMDFAPRNYLMMILDRGGRKMFETTNPGEGWDGRFQGGEFVNEGVYVYHIQYTDYRGLSKTHTGNVTVLYP